MCIGWQRQQPITIVSPLLFLRSHLVLGVYALYTHPSNAFRSFVEHYYTRLPCVRGEVGVTEWRRTFNWNYFVHITVALFAYTPLSPWQSLLEKLLLLQTPPPPATHKQLPPDTILNCLRGPDGNGNNKWVGVEMKSGWISLQNMFRE